MISNKSTRRFSRTGRRCVGSGHSVRARRVGTLLVAGFAALVLSACQGRAPAHDDADDLGQTSSLNTSPGGELAALYDQLLCTADLDDDVLQICPL